MANGINAVHTVDPTLLLKKEEWEKLIKDTATIKGKYILYYSVNCRRYSWEIAKKLSELTHMPVINLVEHPKVFMAGFKNCYDKGPLEFLNIIKNAEYVVTNSFHGVAFSINFKKKFAPVFQMIDGKIQLEERKYDLLKRVGLESLIITDMNEEVLKKISTIDYSAVEKKLDMIRKESLSYIDGVVNDLNN
ncbi:polysaccharide pyruvyl transferase family protein [Enterocloster clostridioformis]|uniref:Polysaccharide pyruvyl transferase n=3 Tax=Enterocloster clostridioformis TaxID=1531 RepID=A0A2X2UJP4_9FIRM|nr:polysaccharide pyruvyl transferase family protein [Enterocloster clostridioformis]SQB16664.1 Polysaccharide pyruvyl transferase [Enterocloster clostridioformis]